MSQLLPTSVIIAKLQRGEDVDGITRYLYKNYGQTIKRYVQKRGCPADDADDILQEVMLTFLRQVRSERFEQRDNTDLGSYLIGITRRKWLKKLEGDGRRADREDRYAQDTLAPETPDVIVDNADYQQWGWSRFQQLGEVCRQILTAYYRDELSLEEIAVRFDLGTVGAVKMRKFRCMQKLVKLVDV
ncbi:hypothetical protein GCM10027341_34810 [Spirosoma knui]